MQFVEVSVDSAPQHPVVKTSTAMQRQAGWPVIRREAGERPEQEWNGLGRKLPEECQGDVPVLDAVPPHVRVCAVGGAQPPGQFFFRVVGRGEGDEHANGRGLSLFVHNRLRTASLRVWNGPGTQKRPSFATPANLGPVVSNTADPRLAVREDEGVNSLTEQVLLRVLSQREREERRQTA